MPELITRRHLLQAGLGSTLFPALVRSGAAAISRSFRLIETAGLRRFGYPVHAILPDVVGVNDFQLTRGGKPISAQFRRFEDEAGRSEVALDFNASLGPLETEDYEVKFGVKGPEPDSGIVLNDRGDLLRVANGKDLHFDLVSREAGVLKSVGSDSQEFIADPGRGIVLTDWDGRATSINDRPVTYRAVCVGPLATSLRFTTPAREQGGFPSSTVDMTFPRSKSWAEITWSANDPDGRIRSLELEFRLAVEGSPTLVDVGASGTVYGQLRGTEAMALEATPSTKGPAWLVRQGPRGFLQPLAVATKGDTRPPEGWVHVMDRRRCTAIAVAGFGRATNDRIEIQANGRVRFSRDFTKGTAGPSRGPKSLTYWLHFVDMPVQVGAATSPQAMLSPLRVEWV